VSERMISLLRLGRVALSRSPGVRQDLLLGSAEECLAVGLGLTAPLLLSWITDDLVGKGRPSIMVFIAIVGFTASWFAPNAIAALKLVHTTRIVEAVNGRLIHDVLQSQLPASFGRRDVAPARTAAALERLPFSLQILLDGLVWRVMGTGLQVVGGLIAIGSIGSVRLMLILGATFLLFVLAGDLGAREFNQRLGGALRASGQLSARVGDVLANSRRVVVNGAITFELDQISTLSALRRAAAQGLASSQVRGAALQFLVLSAGVSLALCLSAVATTQSHTRLGAFVLLQALAVRLAMPLATLSLTLRQSTVALEHLSEVFRLAPRPQAMAAEPSDWTLRDRILRLEKVGFSHTPGAQTLDQISLEIEPGRLVVLAGANGSGKSTLAQLMAGILTPDAGQVSFGGVGLSRLSEKARLRHVLYAPQQLSLFDRSLADNLRYPPNDEALEALVDRLDQWAFDPVSREVDWNRVAGVSGRHLSGGQIQKLELARLARVSADVLILDEPTSALDPFSERMVIQTLRSLTAGRTLILVAHAARLAELADQVLFLERGRIVGLGRHADLLAGLPSYRRLWEDADD